MRRVFLTEIRDPQGNAVKLTYDDQLRLVAITDAIGQVSLLSYDLASDPLKVTRFTDPFGRTASFQYDSQGRLVKITDAINLESSFDYDPGDFIRGMTTPYGTTTFRQTGVLIEMIVPDHPEEANKKVLVTVRTIEATDPLGGTERAEIWPRGLAPHLTPASTPTEFPQPGSMFSLYWDKRAMALAPLDPDTAEATYWRFSPTSSRCGPSPLPPASLSRTRSSTVRWARTVVSWTSVP